jgi:haloacid dehalogenase-like hydrolase
VALAASLPRSAPLRVRSNRPLSYERSATSCRDCGSNGVTASVGRRRARPAAGGSGQGRGSLLDRARWSAGWPVTSLDVGFWKPHAAKFEHALELLGVDAAQAVMVGDSPTKDVAPAKKLGVRAADPAVCDTCGRAIPSESRRIACDHKVLTIGTSSSHRGARPGLARSDHEPLRYPFNVNVPAQ